MDRIYNIWLYDKLIGTTAFEHADPPMGVVFGKIHFIDGLTPYDFVKWFCKNNNIEFADYPDDKLFSTRTISGLKVVNDMGQQIKGLGVQISGMDSGFCELLVEGIPYPFFGEEFPHHVEAYKRRFE